MTEPAPTAPDAPDDTASSYKATRRLLEFFEIMPERPLPAIEELLRAGANPSAHGSGGCTPLHYAASYNDIDLCALLLRYEANVNARDNHGNTPLHYAAKGRGIEAVRFLIAHDADPSLANKVGDTPLLSASRWPASHYDNEADKSLLPHPLTDIHHHNRAGQTALDIAMDHKAIRLASRLATHGAFVPERYDTHFAIHNRRKEAQKRWGNFCSSSNRSATTLEDLHYFSNIGHLGDALHPAMWKDHPAKFEELFYNLHPCHQRLALHECPALVQAVLSAPSATVSLAQLDAPQRSDTHER